MLYRWRYPKLESALAFLSPGFRYLGFAMSRRSYFRVHLFSLHPSRTSSVRFSMVARDKALRLAFPSGHLQGLPGLSRIDQFTLFSAFVPSQRRIGMRRGTKQHYDCVPEVSAHKIIYYRITDTNTRTVNADAVSLCARNWRWMMIRTKSAPSERK